MKNLALAAGMVFVVAAVLFGTMTLVGIDKATALPLASAPLYGIKYVNDKLDTSADKSTRRGLSKGVISFEGFALRWYQMLVYGAFMFAATKQFGGWIAGLTAGAARVSVQDAAFFPIVAVVGNLIAILGAYAICFWIGTRCDKYSYLMALAVPFFGQLIGGAVDFLFLSSANFMSLFGQPKSVGFFLLGAIMGTLIVLPFTLFGVWRGNRARLSAYLSYLLGNLPLDTRQTIINLTYEEVKALSPSQLKIPQPGTA